MKRLITALASACLFAASALGQQTVDNSGAVRVSPYPIVYAFPGGCTYGDVVTYALGTPGSNTYICGATHNWVQLAGGSGGSASSGTGIAVVVSGIVGAAIAQPAGTVVGTTDTQTLTNKNIAGSEINSGTVPAAQLPVATTGALGAVKPDGSTITVTAGVISAVSGGAGTVTVVGAGNLTSTTCVTGGGSQTIQTPSANCAVDASGNLTALSFKTGGPVPSTSGIILTSGKTSGGFAWASADVGGTLIVYVIATDGAAGQILEDTGVTTCPTLPAGSPTLCHLLVWETLGGDATLSGGAITITQIEGAAIPVSANFIGTNSSGQLTAPTANNLAKLNWVAGGGTAQAQTATYSPAVTALVDGLYLCWKPIAANTATAPAFAPNGLTAQTVVKVPNATALVANDLIATQQACAVYDSTGAQWELQNPATAGAGISTSTITCLGTGQTVPTQTSFFPREVACAVYLNQSASIAPTTLYTPITATGKYRLTEIITIIATQSSGPTLNSGLTWADAGTGSATNGCQSGSAINFLTLGQLNCLYEKISFVAANLLPLPEYVFSAVSGTNIVFRIDNYSSAITTGRFNYELVLEQLM